MGTGASSVWSSCGETFETGEEFVESPPKTIQTQQPSEPEAPIAEEEISLLSENLPSESNNNTPVVTRESKTEPEHSSPSLAQESKTEQLLLIPEPKTEGTQLNKTPQQTQHTQEVQHLLESESKDTQTLSEGSQTESRIVQKVHLTVSSVGEEVCNSKPSVEPTVCTETSSVEKDSDLKALHLELVNTMETVDSLVVEQVSVDMAANVEHQVPNKEVLTSLVDQLRAPSEREATPDSDSGGSMHASTGSDGMEDVPQDSELMNGEKEKFEKQDKAEKAKEEKSGKSKKKEDKTIDHILRALSSLQTTEEKLAALCKKYADLHEEHRTIQSAHKQNQRKLAVVTREKDQLQTEHTKAVMAKSKLEGLCRELQKHNQVIRQESLQRAREEDEKRKEISNKFQATISEIQTQMTDHHDRNIKLREENQELAGKLKKFIEQYEVREKQVEKVMHHRELEQKLADAKLDQANAILAEEQEKGKREKQVLLLQATESGKRAQLLETQLAMYKERYEEFQSTINRSNDMFQKFKTEMDKMTKRIKKLEKDGAAWKTKWEKANRALLEMAEEKQSYDKEKPVLLNKIQKLESLCRAMQAERLGRKVAEASNIDISKLGDDLSAASLNSEGDTTLQNKDSESSSSQISPDPQTNLDNTDKSSPDDNCECDKTDNEQKGDVSNEESDQNSDSSEEEEATADNSETQDQDQPIST